MDVHCCNCGEPWDQYHLRHDLSPATPTELEEEGWQFGVNRLVVLHCPSCPKDGRNLPDTDERRDITQELAALLGGDEDGLAAVLEDFALLTAPPRKPTRPRFPLGRILATPGVLDKVPDSERHAALDRHAGGDWGELDAEDVQSNQNALANGGRLFSRYRSKAGVIFWIITEADRSTTTLLLPEEY